jgi:hypothetical protein
MRRKMSDRVYTQNAAPTFPPGDFEREYLISLIIAVFHSRRSGKQWPTD